MKLIVYADVLFFINFIINMVLLFVTSFISGRHTSFGRMCAASVAGAVYALCMFVPSFSFTGTLLCKLALSVCIILLAFGYISFRAYIKHLCIFYIVSLMCGGCVLGCSFLFTLPVSVNNGIVYFHTDIKTLFLCSAVCLIFFVFIKKVLLRYAVRDSRRLTVCKNGKAVVLNVLIDTGNMLTDPITGYPVVVAEKSALRGIVPDNVREDDIEMLSKYISGVRLIPFRSLGCENGIMTAFCPDKVFFRGVLNKSITVAIASSPICSDRRFNALAGPEIFSR